MGGVIVELWSCDRCRKKYAKKHEAEVYENLTIYPPPEWQNVYNEAFRAGEEHLGTFCPECLPRVKNPQGDNDDRDQH